uniref:Retrovirus-related Pol polyprotein from transposon gypsy n=1 Tax=Cajanus cajan TaxID=3821 RepID=A0A151TWJ9_CAJCA|nr:Retrovirus-related Pol polyprotein from transposon gypsy [Cajanus cajan]
MKKLFTCHQVSEEKNVPLATLSFQGYAMYWWTSLERERRLHNDPSIQYLNTLRNALRRRHIPSYYGMKLIDKLQRLQQRNMNVEDYRQKMKLYMIRVGIREEERITISRFLSGISLEIRGKVELLTYRDLNDLVQLCIKVDQPLLTNTSIKKESSKSTPYFKKDHNREGYSSKNYPKVQPPKEKEKKSYQEKETPNTSSRTSSIKCYKYLGKGHIVSKCPTNKTIILREKDIYSSQKKTTSSSFSSESEEEYGVNSNEEGVYPCDDLLIDRRQLGSQPSENHLTQRENIFHTKRKIYKNTCCLIVDSWSYCNYCNTRLVLTNSINTSMRLMSRVLKDCIGRFVVVYFDDILIFHGSLSDHLRHLRQVLLVLRSNNIFANVEKCTFCVDSVVFLGFIVNKKEAHVDLEKKNKAIQEWSTDRSRIRSNKTIKCSTRKLS